MRDSRHQILAGRYELLSLLGKGGMGSVYRARDLELDEMVALKMVRRDMIETPGILERFRQEVRLARKVTHPNVARTFDIAEHEGTRFLTMELVEGEPLRDVLARERRLPLTRVFELAEAICAGLGAAHAAGVVHRDLKPGNVLIAKDGRVVISDFGLARALVPDARITLGVPVGTPAYMAPEQVEGTEGIDERADIYALGAILFELVTGRRAWVGDSAYTVATRRLVEDAPDPRRVDVHVPDPLAAVVMRCMARDPKDRIVTAREVASRLAAITIPAGLVAPSRAAEPSRSPPPSLATALEVPRTVAVLPFRNGGTAEDDYLAEGMTEDLIDTLSMSGRLRVRPRSAVKRYKDASRDPRKIGEELDVQVVADVAVHRSGDRVRTSVELISVADGFQLWAKQYDREAGVMLAVADEVANAIAEALAIEWNAPERRPPIDPRVPDLYLRAKHELAKRSPAATEEALRILEQALGISPDDATILSAYATALARSFAFYDGNAALGEKALETAEKAVTIAPRISEARVALANVRFCLGETTVGAREVHKVLGENPSLPSANALCGRLLLEAGHAEDGLRRIELALQQDPDLVAVRVDSARALELLGRRAECDAELARVPTDLGATTYWTFLGRLVLWRRDDELAKSVLARLAAEASPQARAIAEPMLRGALDKILPAGFREQLAQRASSRTPRARGFFQQLLAEWCAYLGDVDGAFAALAEADSVGLFDLLWTDRCPLFDSMRSDTRFAPIRAHVVMRADAIAAVLS
jgi:serine/threonine-protein kinase